MAGNRLTAERQYTLLGAHRAELGLYSQVAVSRHFADTRSRHLGHDLDDAETPVTSMAATTSGDGLGPELVAGTPLAAEARLSCLGPRDNVPSLLCDATGLSASGRAARGMPGGNSLASGNGEQNRRPVEGRDAGRIPAKGRAPSRTSGSCLLRC